MRRTDPRFDLVDALLVALPLVAFLTVTRLDQVFSPESTPYAQFVIFLSVALLLTASALRRGVVQGSRLAYTDELTGLNNRRSFTEALAKAGGNRQGGVLALLLLDLDRFKLVNDALGHPAGDDLLRMVGGRLKTSVPDESFVARLGGDEFAVIAHVSDSSSAMRMAEEILEDLNEPISVGGQDIWPNASVGVAIAPGKRMPVGELLTMADIALYQAKARGKGRAFLFDSNTRLPAVNKLSMEAELHFAMANKQFEMLFQPVVNLRDRRIIGAEALLRWNHPRRGVLTPDTFLPIANEIGLSRRLSRWIIDEVSAQGRAWEHLFGERLTVSMNVSAAEFQSIEFVQTLGRLVREKRAPINSLSLEVTESSLMGDAATQASLAEAKKLGFKISIDDFGVGFSSLNYLRNNKVDVLKLDPAFVRGKNVRTFRIVRAVVDLAHSLGMTVIAEGIETEEQYTRMLDAGCDCGQGYFFAYPMTAQALTEILADHELALPVHERPERRAARPWPLRRSGPAWHPDLPFERGA